MNEAERGHVADGPCDNSICDCCDGLLPSHVRAITAALGAVGTALREPTADGIPCDQLVSLVQRLGSAVELAQIVREGLVRSGHLARADAMRMIIEKVDRVAREMALAETKGEPSA